MRPFLSFALALLPLVSAKSHHSSAKRSCPIKNNTAPATSSSSLVSTAWYAGWHADEGFPLDAVSWDKYTHLTYSFACVLFLPLLPSMLILHFSVTTPDVHTLSLNGSNPDLLPKFVDTAHKNVRLATLTCVPSSHLTPPFQGVKALVTVGGWTGSLYFSTAVATSENRTAFVKTISDFATKYKLDGVDFE